MKQLTGQVLTTDLKIFETRRGIEWKMANYRGFTGTALFLAPNAPAGLWLDYYAKAAGPVRVTVTSKTGKAVRQLNARAERRGHQPHHLGHALRFPHPPAAGAGTPGRGGRGARGRGGAPPAAAEPGGPPAEQSSEPESESSTRGRPPRAGEAVAAAPRAARL